MIKLQQADRSPLLDKEAPLERAVKINRKNTYNI